MCMHSGISLKRGHNYIGKDRLKNLINEEASRMPLPKDFDEWVREYVLREDHYIYYHKEDLIYIGYCTHCGHKSQLVDKPKQLKKCRCPNCGINAMYSDNRYHGKCSERLVSVLQQCFEGVIERRFHIKRIDRKEEPYINIWEFERIYYGRGCYENERATYVYHSAFNKWLNGDAQSHQEFSQYLYPNNLGFVALMPDMQYCCIKEYADNGAYIHPIGYIKNYQPIIERLVKVGLYNIVNYIARAGINGHLLKGCDRNATDLHGFLSLNKFEDFRMAIKYNVTLEELCGMRLYSASLNRPLDDMDMRAIKFLVKVDRFQYGNVSFKYENYISVNSFIDYYTIQVKKWKSMTIRDYEDYIGACEKLCYNLADTQYLKPKDFKKAHDDTLAVVRLEEDKDINAKLFKIAKRMMKSLGYNNAKYLIEMPLNTNDFVNESVALGHCVKTYATRVAAGDSLIFFIRQKLAPEMPFFTLELNPKHDYRLVQCRTKGNEDMTGAVAKFVDEWLKKIVMPYVEKIKKQSKLIKTA